MTLHSSVRCLVLAAAVALTTAAHAHAADDALYRELGEKPGLSELMQAFVGRLKTDARVGHFFKDIKAGFLARQLTDQICVLAGGPCVYDGEAMGPSHKDLGVARRDFNRVVEVLQDTMDDRHIAVPTQNALLALLAPMHREIITK
ncbi:MAG: group 1 truncated hemoglobin [Rubrivivax sp.]